MQRVERALLLSELESVTPGISARDLMEQSTCFVFRDGLVHTFNDEIACSHESSLEDIEGAVKADRLLQLLRKLEEDHVDIDLQEGELIVSGKNKRAGLRLDEEILLPIDDVEEPDEKDWHDLPQVFGEAVGVVESCAGSDESQELLTCVHIAPKWVEATDNYQLARFDLKTGFKKDCLVKASSIKHIQSLGMSQFAETKSWIHFRNDTGLQLSCRRYHEKYPDIGKLMDFDGDPLTLPMALKDAIGRASDFSAENVDDNQVTVKIDGRKVKIRADGSASWYEESKRLEYDGQPLSFRISPKLLTMILEKHRECELSEDQLKVETSSFVYVTCLGKVD